MDSMEDESGFVKPKLDFAWEAWGVRFASLLTALMGLINLTSAVQPALQERLKVVAALLPLEVLHGSRLTSALAGFALLMLAGSLWRRKRVAWVVTLTLVVVSIISHLAKGLDFEEASLGMGVLILLLVLRKSFHAMTDRPSLRQGLMVLAAGLLFTQAYGAIGFVVLDRHFSVNFNLATALRQTLIMFFSFYNPGLEPLTGFGKYFANSIYIIALATLGFALIMLIRPVLVRDPATQTERVHARQIVETHGQTSLARSTLFPDKSYFFSPGEAVIAYVASRRGAMVLGDPIGPPQAIPEAISKFHDYCVRNDWTPSFASTLPDHLDAYEKAGFEAVCIGFEAIVTLEGFTIEGGENKGIRYAVNRLEKNGYRAEVHQPPLEGELVKSLRGISDAWLTLHHGGEMHFSDGWFDEAYLQENPVIVVHAPDGSPTAFANLVPEYRKNEVTIDLMRHYRNVEHGTMEFMFVRMLQWAREKGYTTFSLGLSAIAGVGEKPDDPRVEQALHFIAENVSRFFNFRGLHEFKQKFHPNWEPRYLVYPGAGSLPIVLTTLLRVHSGDHFLWKFLRK